MDILTDKKQRKYDYVSRYSGIYFYYNTEDDKYMYGITKQTETDSENGNYVLYTVKDTDTLDSISAEYYGRPDLFWILADFNRIQDCFINLKQSGFKTIKIPAISRLKYNFKTKD